MARPLADLVVLVLAADTEVGRAVALAVAARGARAVVVGERERALGELVGEVAFGGGQARHAVGGVAEGTEKARATWGRVDFVVAGDAAAALRDSPEAVAEAVARALVSVVREDGEEAGGAAREP
jgi:NAD(P)-dependent dehydrogenase (short-subunit alcohol dehydrogenase family)